MLPKTPRWLRLLGLLGLVAACGKRTFVPPERDASPPLAAIPADADAVAEVEPEEPAEPLPPGPLAKTCDGVSLVLVSVTRQADRVNAVLELRSHASRYVSLMAPGDGSSAGRRNPTVTFTLTPSHIAPVMGCGNMNPLSKNDFLLLAPGARKELSWVYAPTPSKAGRYTLQVTYRNDPTSTRLGDQRPGTRSAKLRERARATVACTLTSNVVSFDWSQP